MLPDRVSNPGSLTYESGALPIALRGPAIVRRNVNLHVPNSNPYTNFGVKSNLSLGILGITCFCVPVLITTPHPSAHSCVPMAALQSAVRTFIRNKRGNYFFMDTTL